MSCKSLLVMLAMLALAGCNRAVLPAGGAMPDPKPVLSAPPSSMMTPQGY